MTDTITVTGVVANDPRHSESAAGVSITRFRLASAQRRFDRTTNTWVDGETNWYTVSGFRRLGDHLAASVKKSDRVIVTGRLRVRDWQNGEKRGTAVDIDADTVGHDLFWGTSAFTRAISSKSSSELTEEELGAGAAASPPPAGQGWASVTPGGAEVQSPEASPFGDSGPLVQHYPDSVAVNS